jgi:hypothetical protein
MFTICQDCKENYDKCILYVCQTKDGFLFISCIVFAIETGAYILSRVALDLGGGDGDLPDL